MSNVSEKLQQPSLEVALPQTPTIDWLLRSAAGNLSVASMLGELCNRLVSEDVPIAGALLTITTRSDGRAAPDALAPPRWPRCRRDPLSRPGGSC